MNPYLTLLFLSFLLTSEAFAQKTSHLVQVTSAGLGAGVAYEKTNPEERSDFSEFNIFDRNIAINYAYSLLPRLQAGIALANRAEKRSFETRSGTQGKLTYDEFILSGFLIWNFSENLKDTYYTSFTYTTSIYEEEFDKKVFDYLEDDKNAVTYEWAIGKRFDLSPWGLSNITYSPTLALYV